MKLNIIQLWKSKGLIVDGIKNSIFIKEDVEQIAEQRHIICKTNKCGYYDPKGEMDTAYFPGEENCGACGCKLQWKLRSLSSNCGLTVVKKEPLWTAEISEEEENLLKTKIPY